MRRIHYIFLLLIIGLLGLFLANLFYGSVTIPFSATFGILTGTDDEVVKSSWKYIILFSRLPQAITATLCGAALSVSGLLLQTSFRNDLAGPSILGITNGASLGVALIILFTGGVLQGLSGNIAIISGALIGAFGVIAILLTLSFFIRQATILLIASIMIGYLVSAIVSLLYVFAQSDNAFSYIMWGMGSFSDVTYSQMPYFVITTIIGLFMACMLIKPLNLLLLGDDYATVLGVNIRRTQHILLATTGILTAIATAYCGPIAFIGFATPHIARFLFKSANHRILIPATVMLGAVSALACNVICNSAHQAMTLPINAITPLFGVPVIVWVILQNKR